MQNFSGFRGYADRIKYEVPSLAPPRICGHGSWLLADDSLNFNQVNDLLFGSTDCQLLSPETLSQLKLKEGIVLMEHQKAGVQWMRAKGKSTHFGGILADEMGYCVLHLFQLRFV